MSLDSDPVLSHQSLGDVPSSCQRFEMSAVIDQLHLLQVQCLQHLLTGPVHHLQLLTAVHQEQRTTVDPLQGQRTKFTPCRLVSIEVKTNGRLYSIKLNLKNNMAHVRIF